MYRSKKDVDRHVRDILSKTKTEDERKVRGYTIARMYNNIGEHDSARRYLSEFLTVRPRANDAHRLLGQIYEALNMKEKAVQAYKMAYELGEGQRDLVLKICELYCDVPCDPSIRLYWADEGDRLFPHHESVITLREAILTTSNSCSREELEKLYFEEIKANPLNVKLYTSLLQLYKTWEGKEIDAYKYSCKIEARKAFPDSLEWYQILCETSEVYRSKTDVSKDLEFHRNYLSILERLVYLTLASSSGTALLAQCTQTDATSMLHKFDQNLAMSMKAIGGEETVFGQLMVGQLYMHMASVLLQSSKKESLIQSNTSAGALLLHACRFRPSETGQGSRSQTSQDQFWYKLACHRLSQACHSLHHMAKTETEKSQFLQNVKQKMTNKDAQKNVYISVFGNSYSNTMQSGFFMNDEKFCTASLSYPEAEPVKKWDNVVSIMYCSSLRDLVWLCLQQVSNNIRDPQPYYPFTLFEGLQFTTNSMNTGAAETLCHLDLMAFLVATVFCQKAASKDTHGPPPASLPTIVTSSLNTVEQSEWWLAAHTLFNNRAHHRLSKLRLTLQRGLEVIRAIGNHGNDLILMAHLAQCFTKWAQVAKTDGSSRNDVEALEDRAKHYWDNVLSMCQKAGRNSNIVPRNRLFVVQSETLSSSEIEKVQEEGKYFLAMRLVHAGKKQEAIQALGTLKSPEASYERAMLYKQEAQAIIVGSNDESVSQDMRVKYTSLLRQARDTLYLTLDRLRMPEVDRCHPLNAKLSQQLEDVERSLSQTSLNPDMTQREDEGESLSDDSQSRLDLTNGHMPTNMSRGAHMFSTPIRESNRNGSRIARQEARPSPERLDAQVRALTEVQEQIMRSMDERNSLLVTQNEELRKLCTALSEKDTQTTSMYREMLEQNKRYQEKDNHTASMYREMLEQNKKYQDNFNVMVAALSDLQTHVTSVAEDLSEVVKTIKEGNRLIERAEPKLEEQQVPVELPTAAAAAAVVSPNYYVNYYDQQVPYPYRPSAGFLRFPPFAPPSTLPEQSYSLPNSFVQVPGVSTIAQASAAIVTPTPSSPATIIAKEPVSSPAVTGLSLAQGMSQASFSSLSSSLATTTLTTGTPRTILPSSVETSIAPHHPFHITLPPTSTTLTPPPGSTPGEQVSFSLPCSTTGLLASVPAPLYSAVTPDSSPLRGQPKVQSLSTVLSPEGLTPVAGSGEAATTPTKQDGSFIAQSPECANVSPNKGRDTTDEEEHDPCPDYKPIIPLPEKVEVRTGEEEELVMFEDRAKLFRFVDREWKERGTGVMKLLHNTSQDSVRVLMRRDQTHKICANHSIFPSIDITPMQNNDKAWIWPAKDYADEELRTEKFCCRFKTPEIATAFKDAFVAAKEIVRKKEEEMERLGVVKEKAAPAPAPTGQKSLAQMFKAPEGSWNCNTCLVNNTADKTACAACQTPNPNAPKASESQITPQNTPQKPFAGFKFSPTAPSSSATSSPGSFKIVTTSTVVPPIQSTTPLANVSGSGMFSLSKFGVTDTSTPTTTTASTTPKVDASKETFSMSGFSFFAPPKPEKAEETPQKGTTEEKKKDSVFGNFTFGNIEPKTTNSSFIFSSNPVPASDNKSITTGGTGLFTGTANKGNLSSFGNLASDATPSASIFKKSDAKAFEPKPLFGGTATKSPGKDGDDDKVEEYEPQVDFEPVVPLPDLVEVKTGEEEEAVLFCERCKLFRFDVDTKEWKERGVGDLKILKSNASGKVRILMRRDQVHKICANHLITADIKITPMAASDKAWIWAANDFADEEMKYEKFAARFKNPELATNFKTAFETAQKSLADLPKESVGVEKVSSTTTDSKEKPKAQSLAEMFKPKAGSWECNACLVRNTPEATSCASCSAPKPGSDVKKEVSPQPATVIKGSDSKPSLAALFKPAAGSWECDSCLVRNKAEDKVCAACGTGGSGEAVSSTTAEPKSTFSFGIKKDNSTSSVGGLATSGFTFGETEKKPAFSFGIPSNSSTTVPAKSAFTFGVTPQATPKNDSSVVDSKPAAFSFGVSQKSASQPFTFSGVTSSTPGGDTSTPAKDPKSGFVFGSPEAYKFEFSGVKPRTPRSRDVSTCESEDGVVDEDEGDHLYFEPVVPLPDKVDVVTGEEDEAVLYSSRAKLHRLVTGEWRERGLGDIKVLEHKRTGKMRLLMRREQVHKICLNHSLEVAMDFRKKDEKTFYWAAVDYSENKPQNETFAIRFKTPEIAIQFYKAVDDAKVKLGAKPTEVPITLPTSPKKTDEAKTETLKENKMTTPAKAIVSADSTTPVPNSATNTPTGSLFGGTSGKTLFGNTSGTPGTLFGSGGTTGQSLNGGLSAVAAKTNEPNFSINASNSFSFKDSQLGTPRTTGGSQLFGSGSIFGGAPGLNTIVKSPFSFGDRFAKEEESAVEIVFEKKATPEQVEKARKLKLPDNFFLYEEAPPCPGCIGCQDSDEGAPIKTPVGKASSASPSTSLFGSSAGSKSSTLTLGGVSTPPLFGGATSFQGGDKATSLFGGSATKSSILASATSSNPSIFGSMTTSTSSKFGSPATSTTSIFGNAATSSPSIFGSATTTTPSLFGGANTSTPTLFGNSASSTPSIFGGTTSTSNFAGAKTSTPSIFGGSPSTQTSIFGSSSSTPTNATSLFGGASTTSANSGTTSTFGGPTTTSASSTSIFGGAVTTTASIFGSASTNTTSSGSAATTTANSLFSSPSSTSIFSNSGSGGLFSGQSGNTTTFGDIAKASPTSNFANSSSAKSDIWSQKVQPVFGSKSSPKKEGNADDDEEDEHDPHFEPVVPLPELVEVKTGEEDLEVIFSNRGKLYRYDTPTKQWKERGVGDFKILYDAANIRYRLIQRREQVYKICCNHNLTPLIELKPMQSSETAWCWFAIDYSEKAEGTKEQLAIRFKNKDIATEFKTKFEECQEKLRQTSLINPADSVTDSASATIVLPHSTPDTKKNVEDSDEDDEDSDEDAEEEEDEDSDEDEDFDDEEEEESDTENENPVIFLSRCTLSKKENDSWKNLGTGDLRIVYDDEFYGARIVMVSDGGETLAEHIIAIQTAMHKEGNSATWTVLNLEPPPEATVTFKAQFSSTQAVKDFAVAFSEGKEYADKSGIAEEPPVQFPTFTFNQSGGATAGVSFFGQGAKGEE